MKHQYQLTLHIFRRDLRLQDNTALIEALASSEEVIPCFIFDSRQVEDNAYKGDHCIQFMLNSLHELDTELKKKDSQLYFFSGIAEDVIKRLLQDDRIDAVFINRDYTPFSLQRDQHIREICEQKKIDFHCYADALLHEPEEVYKPNKLPYTVFTPFYKKASQLAVAAPRKNIHSNYYRGNITSSNARVLNDMQKDSTKLAVKGGRKEALTLLKKATDFYDYQLRRDFPGLDSTTKLSAHNKFGTLSIREFYHFVANHLGKSHSLINEMYWRDFFTHIIFHYPAVLGKSFQEKFAAIRWKNNHTYFKAWCEGLTGFPIVDAGMRELNETGYMHNRVRMIVASFLTKDLHIDWQWGEKYFAQKLVDYDPAVNNGNWQWAASTGCDAQPYFRIFNPWLQQKKFDADCVYIKRWVPELADIEPKKIHSLYMDEQFVPKYARPIVDHGSQSQQAKILYKQSQELL
ncbi:MAG: deoxyribodipyrimidine photo-lyase [Gammaproteobacteria bacterium]